MDPNTLHNNFHTKLRHSTSKLLDLEASVAAEVDQVILVSRTGAKATEEDGDLSQEEVDEVTPRMDLAVLDSPVPLAARADQEPQEDLEVAVAVEDQVTPRALELRQTLASDPHQCGTLLSRPS